MKILGNVNHNNVLVQMNTDEFRLLTGISNICDFAIDHNQNFPITDEVTAALRLLTFRKSLEATACTLNSLAELCRTELPVYKAIQDAHITSTTTNADVET
jgi:hypothetical protein